MAGNDFDSDTPADGTGGAAHCRYYSFFGGFSRHRQVVVQI